MTKRPSFCLGVAQFGSALEWGSRGRKFKSSHSDQFCKKPFEYVTRQIFQKVFLFMQIFNQRTFGCTKPACGRDKFF